MDQTVFKFQSNSAKYTILDTFLLVIRYKFLVLFIKDIVLKYDTTIACLNKIGAPFEQERKMYHKMSAPFSMYNTIITISRYVGFTR